VEVRGIRIGSLIYLFSTWEPNSEPRVFRQQRKGRRFARSPKAPSETDGTVERQV
jgi:hypothetical protein